MKLTTTQPTDSIDPTPPADLPLEAHNPLIWIIALTALITAIEKPLTAIAHLLRALTLLQKTPPPQGRSKK